MKKDFRCASFKACPALRFPNRRLRMTELPSAGTKESEVSTRYVEDRMAKPIGNGRNRGVDSDSARPTERVVLIQLRLICPKMPLSCWQKWLSGRTEVELAGWSTSFHSTSPRAIPPLPFSREEWKKDYPRHPRNESCLFLQNQPRLDSRNIPPFCRGEDG